MSGKPELQLQERSVWGQWLLAIWSEAARQLTEVFVVAGVLCLTLAAFGQNPVPAKSTEDLPSDPMQSKASTACTECHEARIIVQQRLSKAAWTKEVDKMIKWGALVDASDHDGLVDYLSKYFGPEQPPYVAPRTAAEKNAARKPTK